MNRITHAENITPPNPLLPQEGEFFRDCGNFCTIFSDGMMSENKDIQFGCEFLSLNMHVLTMLVMEMRSRHLDAPGSLTANQWTAVAAALHTIQRVAEDYQLQELLERAMALTESAVEIAATIIRRAGMRVPREAVCA